MMEELSGKKLLILGAYESEAEIVREAKRLGIYTIVTDNHTDWSMAPAKYVADEAWDISWSDIELLSKKCMEEKIDGCLAGFSERRVGCAQQLCNVLGLPFYSDGARLDIIFDKCKFKNACRECNIRVPKEYDLAEGVKYPVIVKPVDNGGTKGITICYSDEQLDKACDTAKSLSDSGKITIEEYLTSDEAVIYYYVQNGNAVFVAMCDRYVYKQKDRVQLPTAYVFPSRYTKRSFESIDKKIQNLFKRLGVANGAMFLQAFVVDGEPVIYEPGYRLNGARENYILSAVNGIDSMDMLINYSLLRSMADYDIVAKNDPYLHGKYGCKLSPLIGLGKIADIRGMDRIADLPSVVKVVYNNNIGDEIDDGKMGTLQQVIVEDSLERLKDTIDFIQDNVEYVDSNGKSMMLEKFNTDLLLKNYR